MKNGISEHEVRLRRMEQLTRLLDDAFVIPRTNVRVGLDGLIGLIPGIGDLTSAAISGYLLLEASRLGAPLHVIGRMSLNVLIDTVVGAVPVVGDIFDIAWRANRRNLKILTRWLERSPK